MSAVRELDEQPEPVHTNIYDIVVELDYRWRTIIEQQDVIFTSYVAKDLKDPILSHPDIIKRSIDAVLSMSAQNTQKGRIHLHVTAQAGRDEDEIMLSAIIADTGSGLVPDEQNGGVNSANAMRAVRHDAQSLGGTVAINCNPGRGAEVSLFFQARKRAATDLLDEIEMIMSKTPDAFSHEEEIGTGRPGETRSETDAPFESTNDFLDEILSDVAQSQPITKRGESALDSPTVENTVADAVLELGTSDEVEDILDFTEEDMVSDTVDLDVVGEILSANSIETETPLNPEPVQPAVSRGASRLLIVEDETSNQEVIKLLLADVDFEILSAYNGHEALQVMRTQAVDVILMDIRMPEMDGIQTIRAIRNCQADYNMTPIIALTADHSAETNADCMAAGADIFLSKPVIGKDLIEAIQFVLSDQAQDAIRKTG